MTVSLLMLCVIALVSGCENPEYCDIAKPMFFGSDDTIEYLLREDQQLLRAIVTHNEVRSALCKAG